MTTFGDNIISGNQAVTSALASLSPVMLTKTHRFTQPSTGGATPITATGVFPADIYNLDAKLYILANSSATVSDKITVSAAGTNLITISSFGSASGVLRSTTTGLGTLTTTASACAVVAGAVGAELSYAATFLPVSASRGDYQLELRFTRKDKTFD